MVTINSYEIKPGKGIDKIKFGMTMKEVTDIIGQPDESEKYSYPEGDHSVTYSYISDGFDLTFESVNDNLLSYISVFTDQFHINNKIRIGNLKEEVLQALQEDNFSESIVEDLGDEEFPDNELVYLKNENINLWFTSDKLDEIQFGPFWKDDETPIWP